MTEEEIVLLDSRFIDVLDVIHSTDPSLEAEEATNVKFSLANFIDKCNDNLELLERNSIVESQTVHAKVKGTSYSKSVQKIVKKSWILTDDAEFDQAKSKYHYLLSKQRIDYGVWGPEDDKEDQYLSRDDYLQFSLDEQRKNGVLFITTSLLLCWLFATFTVDSYFFLSLGLVCVFLSASLFLRMLLRTLNPVRRGWDYSPIALSFILSETFNPRPTSAYSLAKKHISFLTLGQFFQSKDCLYRFVGFVNGRDHVFMLRKKIFGSSYKVEHFVDRFSQPVLVVLTLQEFLQIYIGNDLEETDEWWSSKIISPHQNWT